MKPRFWPDSIRHSPLVRRIPLIPHGLTSRAIRHLSERQLRFEKRLPGSIEWAQESRKLAQLYNQHRLKVVEMLQSEKNIDQLFERGEQEVEVPEVQEQETETNAGRTTDIDNHGSFQRDSASAYDSSYSSPLIHNSILLLADSFVNSIVVELNIRKLLRTDGLPESPLFRNVIREMKDTPKKHEILKELSRLYDKQQGKPVSVVDFLSKLDPVGTRVLVERFKDDCFGSLSHHRLQFEHYKSGNHHNYENADCVSEVRNERYAVFTSSMIDNSEYINSFQKAFRMYEKDEANKMGEMEGPLPHLRLIAGIVNTLLRPHSTPDISMFKFLMDKFADLGLRNYERLVFRALATYHTRAVSLVSGNLSDMDHERLVTQNPLFISTLLRYYSHRKNIGAFKKVLSYLGLAEVQHHTTILGDSFLADCLAKSKYAKVPVDVPSSSVDGVVQVKDIQTAMEACIDLGLFEYVDSLFNKVVIHGMEKKHDQDDNCDDPLVTKHDKRDSPLVLLRLHKSFTPDLLLTRYANLPPYKLSSRIFDKKMVKLLLRASCESDDMGRLMWLIPHLDLYIERNYSLDDIEKLRAGDSVEGGIDRELVGLVYKALTRFGLEGKLVTYDGILDFQRSS